jgi:hypothetical protein
MKIKWIILTLALVLLPGCPVRQETESPPESPEPVTKPATPEPVTEPVADASGYIKCVGRLVEYDTSYQRCEFWTTADGNQIQDLIISQEATFRISSPSIYAGRTVGVLCGDEADLFTTSPPISKKGKGFSLEFRGNSFTSPFEIPEDFFTGKFGTIDRKDIRNFRAMP